jgi:aromatic ring-opening dioxygenase LigB subunit
MVGVAMVTVGTGDRLLNAGYLITRRQQQAFNMGFIGSPHGVCWLHSIAIILVAMVLGVRFDNENRIIDCAYSARFVERSRASKLIADEYYLINLKTTAIIKGGIRSMLAVWLCFWSLKIGGYFAYYNG